ncbi:MAG: hypothetical protein NZ521_07570, partial [Flammeovirgaceae bacterium]|nr:hypothetical protein [Flammeovirgaceae bacterium]MDW8288061.1 hypothetical protein [Flammeovirgaceae bacterium]
KNNYVFLVLSILFSILLKIVFTKLYPASSEETTLEYVYFQTLEVVDEPLLLTKILVCFFIGFGCFIWTSTMKFSIQDFNDELKTICFLVTLLHLVFPIIGGKDMTRIIFLGFPFAMTLALLKWKECKDITKTIAILFSIPLMRISEDIPDFMKNPSIDAKWHLEVADYGEVAAWGVYALFCYVILYHLETSPKISTNI